jgi:hypothetical protein
MIQFGRRNKAVNGNIKATGAVKRLFAFENLKNKRMKPDHYLKTRLILEPVLIV